MRLKGGAALAASVDQWFVVSAFLFPRLSLTRDFSLLGTLFLPLFAAPSISCKPHSCTKTAFSVFQEHFSCLKLGVNVIVLK